MDLVTYRILERLQENQYIPAAQLAAAAQVSERTVRTRSKELSAELAEHGAGLVAKPKYGYRLEITNQAAYQEWYGALDVSAGSGTRERVALLLGYLLEHPQYVKIDDLCEQLYVSRNTMSADLKQIESVLKRFHLSLEKRPNYGLRIVGSEMNRRRCIAGCLTNQAFQEKWEELPPEKLHALEHTVTEVLHNSGLEISKDSFEKLLTHIGVAICRIQQHYLITIQPQERERLETKVGEIYRQAAQVIAEKLSQSIAVTFPVEEVLHLSIHLSGKTHPDASHQQESGLVISSSIDALVLRMLTMVYKSMGLDFRDNLSLRMSLNQHLVPLDIRMTYGIPLKNPILAQFKQEYSFAYAVAATACTVLQEHYRQPIPEDEIAYIGSFFALALETKDRAIVKKNIVVVCASGRGSAQLFVYKYKQVFGAYIDRIYECSVFALKDFDFKGKAIDYVFTTVPLNVVVPVPVFEISIFLREDDVERYRRLFEFNGDHFLFRFYDETLFLPHITADSKEEALELMCRHAAAHREVPENFLTAVLTREKMGSTDFGNLVAIPHPQWIMTKDRFVVVGLLDKPVWWGRNEVQAVFLVSLSEERDSDIERFYDCTTGFLSTGEAVRTLLEKRTFQTLIHLLSGGKELPQ